MGEYDTMTEGRENFVIYSKHILILYDRKKISQKCFRQYHKNVFSNKKKRLIGMLLDRGLAL